METETSLKKDWTVTPEAFNKLLTWLDAEDREAAAEKYEKIRLRLIKLFKWRNCRPEEEYTDLTINRVTRRIAEGAPVEVSNPYLYFHGTAVNVIREFWRNQLKHKSEDLEKLSPTELSTGSPEQQMEQDYEKAKTENRYECMRKCLRELPPETRQFIVEYHHGERKKDFRKIMSEKLKVPLNTLRIRACRIRAGLEKCVEHCVKKKL